MTKKGFVEAMSRIQDFYRRMERVERAVQLISPDTTLFFADVFESVVDLVKDAFNDDPDGWIEYFLYERDWLSECDEVLIQNPDGALISVESWEELYNFLVDELGFRESEC